MDEQFAHVAVSPLADAEKLLLAAGRVFPRDKAQPRSEIAGLLELSTAANGCKKCSGSQCSDARNRHEPTSDIFAIGDRLDLPCDVADALLQLAQVRKQVSRAAYASPAKGRSIASSRTCGRSSLNRPAPCRSAMPYSRQNARI